MKIRVQITNSGHVPISYSYYAKAYARYNNPLLIRDPSGKTPPYIGPWNMNQEMVGNPSPSIRPGELVTLFEIDLSDYCYLDRPGRYTIQYRGGFGGRGYAPPSNTLEVDVAFGTPSPADAIVGCLLGVLPHLAHLRSPESWVLVKLLPAGWDIPEVMKGELVVGAVITDDPIHGEDVVRVYETRRPITLTMPSARSEGPPIEMLGTNQWGHVYLQIPQRDSSFLLQMSDKEPAAPPDAEEFAQKVKGLIRKALEIKTPEPTS